MAQLRQKKTDLISDFHLTFWTGNTSETDLKSSFKKKWDWVVSDQNSNALWYCMIISNLRQQYHIPDDATVDSVREVLATGIRKSAFDRLKLLIQASTDELSRVVGIPSRTLARREVFKLDESERIFRVAKAFQRTLEVFEDLGKSRRWFQSPKRALGNKTPLQFCDTELGAEEVMNLLGRIEHGVFS